MRAPNGRLIAAAAILFGISFVLPAADLGPAGRPAARGFVAGPLAAFALPLALRALDDARRPNGPSPRDAAYAVAAGAYFGALFLANFVALYTLLAGPGRFRTFAVRVVTACAVLVWGVPFVDYARIYRALGLADAEDFRLRIGYYAWALSFALLAAAHRMRTSAVSDSPGAAG